MALQLTSPAFEDGARIPSRHTADGADLSPPLRWTGAPQHTRAFAVIVDDPDAPTVDPWIHWVLYHIPAEARELPEHIAPEATPARLAGVRQGMNSWSRIGYGGPAPPRGDEPHRYRFTLYALDAELDLAPAVRKQALQDALAGHVLAQSTLTATYARPQ